MRLSLKKGAYAAMSNVAEWRDLRFLFTVLTQTLQAGSLGIKELCESSIPNSVPQGRLKFRPIQIRFERCVGSATALSLQRPSPFCHPEATEGSAVPRTSPGNAERQRGGWCFHEYLVMIGGGRGPIGGGHTNGALQIPRLPRISCRECGFAQLHVVLFKENHISGRW